ncbi:hypothetical protein FB451DRAFT_1213148 [Mycena latifolia]|nr:hypothetical protein FB451DRAFT_1213148 [Mycena latifolia]
MDVKIDHADTAMQNAGKLIQQVAHSASKKQNKTNIRKILTAIQQTMGVLSGAAEYDTRAKTAVAIFMSVLQLEIDRRDNDEEIVAVCYSMTSMIYVLRHLNNHRDQVVELLDQLEEQMTNISTTIKEFGAFADVYYTKCKSCIVRFCRAGEFKQTIRGFVTQFHEYQTQIEFVLVAQMAGNQTRVAENLREIQQGIAALIDHVDVPTSENEKKAWEYIKTHGVQVIETPEGRTHVAKILQESITSNTIDAINSALDELVEKNSTLFVCKLNGATMELNEAIDRSTNKILNRLDSGPHDLIEPDVKEIWKGNGWKFSVKSRTFVDALCNFYTTKFAAPPDGEAPADSWTLKILGKVINYPSLGEAIDEDASGFISVHEMNHFLKRNKEDTTPTWFAFWAVGPQYLNEIYTEELSDIMEGLEDRCRKLKSEIDDDTLDLCIDEYLDTIQLVKFITDWEEFAEGISGVEDMDVEREDLVRVADRLAKQEREIIEEELNRIDYRLTSASMLPPVTRQTGFRIEQRIMVLLYVILRKHQEIISGGMQNMTPQVFASQWEAMDATLTILVFEFHDRFQALCRSWRSQKQDVALQISCYAGGLFVGWYQEYTKPKNLISKFIEDEEPDEEATPPSLDAKVDQLSQRVAALDTRLDAIEALLKKLAGDAAPGKIEAVERTKSGSRQVPQPEEYSDRGGQYEDQDVGHAQDPDGAASNDGREGYNATWDEGNEGGNDGDEGGNDGDQTGDPEEPADPDDY